MKYDGFCGRPSVGGRPGARTPCPASSPLNPAMLRTRPVSDQKNRFWSWSYWSWDQLVLLVLRIWSCLHHWPCQRTAQNDTDTRVARGEWLVELGGHDVDVSAAAARDVSRRRRTAHRFAVRRRRRRGWSRRSSGGQAGRLAGPPTQRATPSHARAHVMSAVSGTVVTTVRFDCSSIELRPLDDRHDRAAALQDKYYYYYYY